MRNEYREQYQIFVKIFLPSLCLSKCIKLHLYLMNEEVPRVLQSLVTMKPGYTIALQLENIMSETNLHNDVAIMCGNWIKIDIESVIRHVQEWRVPRVLYVEYNKWPRILLSIADVSFPNLKKLFLRGNQIESIEGINHLVMPVLQDIWLGGNLINSIQPLRKANFPILTDITLNTNKIVEFKLIEFTNFPHLNYCSLEHSADPGCQDFGFLHKLHNQNGLKVYMLSPLTVVRRNRGFMAAAHRNKINFMLHPI